MTTASAVREGDLPRVPTASNVHQKREETEEEEKVAGDVIMDSPSLCNNKKKIYHSQPEAGEAADPRELSGQARPEAA